MCFNLQTRTMRRWATFGRPMGAVLLLLLIAIVIGTGEAYTSKCGGGNGNKARRRRCCSGNFANERRRVLGTLFAEYGRTCKDIGCLPSEVCSMAVEQCSYAQRDGKDCGSYPTCMRNPNGGGGGSQSPGRSTSTSKKFARARNRKANKIGNH